MNKTQIIYKIKDIRIFHFVSSERSKFNKLQHVPVHCFHFYLGQKTWMYYPIVDFLSWPGYNKGNECDAAIKIFGEHLGIGDVRQLDKKIVR